MTEHLEQIAAVHVDTVLKDSDVTRKLGLVPMDVTPFTRGSTAPKVKYLLTLIHVLFRIYLYEILLARYLNIYVVSRILNFVFDHYKYV